MKKAVVLSLIFILLFIAAALAETTIKSEVDKAALSTDEVLTYKLTITTLAKNVPYASLPKFEGFYIISQAQSSAISFEQGVAKSNLVYTFILAPQNTGKFKIELSKITIEGKSYSSQEFEIEVTQGKTKPKTPPVNPQAKPEENLPESEEEQITL
jgi:hypothetical protein